MPIRRDGARYAKAWCWRSSREFIGPAAADLRLEDNFLITEDGNENCAPIQTIFVWRTAQRCIEAQTVHESDSKAESRTRSGAGRANHRRDARGRNRLDGVRCHQHSQPHRRRIADGAVHAVGAAAAGLDVTWQEVEDGARQRGRPLEGHRRRQEPDVQRPHGYFEHRPTKIFSPASATSRTPW